MNATGSVSCCPNFSFSLSLDVHKYVISQPARLHSLTSHKGQQVVHKMLTKIVENTILCCRFKIAGQAHPAKPSALNDWQFFPLLLSRICSAELERVEGFAGTCPAILNLEQTIANFQCTIQHCTILKEETPFQFSHFIAQTKKLFFLSTDINSQTCSIQVREEQKENSQRFPARKKIVLNPGFDRTFIRVLRPTKECTDLQPQADVLHRLCGMVSEKEDKDLDQSQSSQVC